MQSLDLFLNGLYHKLFAGHNEFIRRICKKCQRKCFEQRFTCSCTMSKQTTLFQTWGYEGNIPTSQLNQSVGSSVPSTSQKNKGKSRRSIEEDFLQDDDDEDALLIQAMEASMASYEKEKCQTGGPTCNPLTINDPVDFEELPEIPQTQATGNTSYSYHI